MSKKSDSLDRYFLPSKDRSYSFIVHSYGRFTNNVISSNLIRLSQIFDKRSSSSFNKETEYVASDQEFILSDALMCCVAAAIDLESYRSYLVMEEKKFIPKTIYDDIAKILFPRDNLKADTLSQLIKEVFIVRDAIVHGHKHKVKVKLKDWKPEKVSVHVVSHPMLKAMKFGDPKSRLNVSIQTKKTKLAKLNVTLPKIALIDVLKILVIIDLINKFRPKSRFDMVFQLENPYWELWERAEWDMLAFDLTFIILYFINKTAPNSHTHVELKKFVEKIQRIFPDVPHTIFKKYMLYRYDLWDKHDFIKYTDDDIHSDWLKKKSVTI